MAVYFCARHIWQKKKRLDTLKIAVYFCARHIWKKRKGGYIVFVAV